jgi:RHS repeat-associated protein
LFFGPAGSGGAALAKLARFRCGETFGPEVYTGGGASPHRDPVGFGGQFGYYTEYETGPGNSVAGSSLLLLTHRYYDPATGRFVNRDPIGYDGGINLYGFAGGNPVNRIDPNGTDEFDAFVNLTSHRNDIIRIAKKYNIQPVLLAGVVWLEGAPDSISGWNIHNRSLSITKFALTGRGSVGLTQYTKFTYTHDDPAGSGQSLPADFTGSYSQRLQWAQTRDQNDLLSIEESAQLLSNLASRKNRYPGLTNNLTPNEMAIVLSEYNAPPTQSPASAARPRAYGKKFLRDYRKIKYYLYQGMGGVYPNPKNSRAFGAGF